jgi:hypothetical protein
MVAKVPFLTRFSAAKTLFFRIVLHMFLVVLWIRASSYFHGLHPWLLKVNPFGVCLDKYDSFFGGWLHIFVEHLSGLPRT